MVFASKSDNCPIDFSLFSCCFQPSPLVRLGRVPVPNVYEHFDFGAISTFMIFKKEPFGRPFRPSRRQKTPPASHQTALCRDPVFHETIVITVPLGPGVF